MSDVIGRGVIEVSADSRKLTAGIDEAKKSLNSLGIAASEATKGQSASIDRYVKSLGTIAVTAGKSGRELELYKLALRGASAEQLKAADSALRVSEAYDKSYKLGEQIKTSLMAVGVAAVGGLIAAYAAFDQLTKKAGDFQDMAEKTGDSAQNIASLAVAAGTAGASMDAVVSASIKLTKGLTGVDDESKAAGAAVKSLGLNIATFKAMAPADQFEAVGKAMAGFSGETEKVAVATALFGKSGADLLPFLKELGQEGGRQIILTQAQIEQADAYADKQAKLRTELSLHAQAIATQMLPAYNAFNEALIEVAKELLHVENGVSTLTTNNAITEFAGSAAKGLATIADAAYAVGQTVRAIGESYGAAAAMIAAVGRGELLGANAIFNAARQSGDAMKFSLGLADKVEQKLSSIAKKSSFGGIKDDSMSSWGNDPKQKKLNFSGANKAAAGKDTAGQEAKAQLGLDLENIKIKSEQITSTYGNAEKVLESLRAAGLVDEQDYYAAKLQFLQLNGAAEEQSLTDQIARMERENLLGKDRINNDKKIAEARAKRDTVKAANSTGTTVLGIQGEAASTKRTKEIDDFFAKAQEDATSRNIANVEAIRTAAQTQVETEQAGYKLRIDALIQFRDESLANRMEGNQLIEEEEKRHKETLEGLQLAAGQNVLSIAQSSADQLYSALKEAGLEQTALGKAMFAVQKGLQIASIIVNTEVAAAAAQAGMIAAAASTAAISGPAGPGILAAGIAAGATYATITRAIGYASAGLVAGTAIAQASAENGYDIPDGVNPIVQTHAKEMILPRAQANVIRDLAKDGGSRSAAGGSGSGAITIVNNTSAKIGKVTEQRLSNGDRALVIEEAVAAVAAEWADPNSKNSRSFSRHNSNQRSR